MAPGDSAFAGWRRDLRPAGFRGLGTGGRKGTYVGRRVGCFEQAIGVLVNYGRAGAFSVQLNINMPLRCADPPHNVVLLEADLSGTGVRIVEPWVHDPSLVTWWPPGEKRAAWTALNQYGLAWLDEFSDPGRLIAFFEAEYARHESAAQPSARISLLASLVEKLGLNRPKPRSAHFQYLLWLSMLYEVEGRMDRARDRLESYAAAVRERNLRSEAKRLEQHRRALR